MERVIKMWIFATILCFIGIGVGGEMRSNGLMLLCMIGLFVCPVIGIMLNGKKEDNSKRAKECICRWCGGRANALVEETAYLRGRYGDNRVTRDVWRGVMRCPASETGWHDYVYDYDRAFKCFWCGKTISSLRYMPHEPCPKAPRGYHKWERL